MTKRKLLFHLREPFCNRLPQFISRMLENTRAFVRAEYSEAFNVVTISMIPEMNEEVVSLTMMKKFVVHVSQHFKKDNISQKLLSLFGNVSLTIFVVRRLFRRMFANISQAIFRMTMTKWIYQTSRQGNR